MASTDTELRPDTTFAGYRIEAVVGRGGMGVVYRAVDLRLKRPVALKLIAPELAEEPRFRERFLRESELAASIDHPNIVPIYEAGEAGSALYLAMRYVEGTDLATLLEAEAPLEPARTVALLDQVADALDAAHEHGLVHRDVKPANVLIAPQRGREHCYLADFGLSRGAGGEQEPSLPSHLSGTVDYTAPEQIAHEPAGTSADVYSLACVLYECLAGKPPFERPRAMATLFAHTSEPPPSLRAARADLPEAIDAVILEGLAKEPEQRYATCRELTDAAREALGLGVPRLTRRGFILAASTAVAALAAASAVAAVVLTRDTEQSAVPAAAAVVPVSENSLVRIDPATNRPVAAIPVGLGPERVLVGEGSVWIANATDRTLTEVDPETNAVLRTVDVAGVGRPGALAAGEGAIWIADRGTGVQAQELWRYDPASGELTAMPEPLHPFALAVGAGSVWVDDLLSGTLRIDPATWAVVDPGLGFLGVPELGAGALWFIRVNPTRVVRVDPATNQVVKTIELGFPHDFTVRMAVEEKSVWVTRPDEDAVVRIDPSTGRVVDLVRVGRDPRDIVVGAGAVWVASGRDGTVTRIDPGTLDTTVVEIGGSLRDLAFGEGAVWVTVVAP
jgi:streptogramin lyase